MRFFNFIFGILSIICGGVFLMNPGWNFAVFSYISAIVMGVYGIGSIISYFINRKKFINSAFEVVAGTAGLILGIFGVVYMIFTLIDPSFIVYMKIVAVVLLMAFIIFEGITMIVEAIRNKNRVGTGRCILFIILGLLMIALGGFGLFEGLGVLTIAAFITEGIILGAGLVASGIGIMVSAFR